MGIFKKSPEEKLAASPQGLALEAYERGDSFFQVGISRRTVERWDAKAEKNQDSISAVGAFASKDVLGQIEEVGWNLEHASWVFAQTNSYTTDGSTSISGETIGVYLFRRRSGVSDPRPD